MGIEKREFFGNRGGGEKIERNRARNFVVSFIFPFHGVDFPHRPRIFF